MPLTHNSLSSLFSDIADAIRAKTGSNASMVADDFPQAIADIPSGGGGGGLALGLATSTSPGTNNNLSFTVLGEPMAFSCLCSNRINTGMNRVVAVHFDGVRTYGVYAYTSNGNGFYYSEDYTWSYNNGVLTVSTTGQEGNGQFHTGKEYRLIYVY